MRLGQRTLYVFLVVMIQEDYVHFKISYRNKGVKVELGIPPELWDAPSAEVTDMQRKVHR